MMAVDGMKTKRWIRVGLLLAAVLCIVWGVLRGEAGTVLIKSVNICLECIGLG